MSPIYIARCSSKPLNSMPNRCRVNYGYVEKTSLSLSFALFMLTRNATAGGAADWFGWSTEVINPSSLSDRLVHG